MEILMGPERTSVSLSQAVVMAYLGAGIVVLAVMRTLGETDGLA